MISETALRNPVQTVPAEWEIRRKIRDEARTYVRNEKLIPPQTLVNLRKHIRLILEQLQLSDAGLDDFAVIMLNNALWEQCFPSIPKEQRLLLLPFCLRHQTECKAPRDDLGLICDRCGRCDVPRLSDVAENLGMPVLVAESSSRVVDWVESGEIQAVIGVSCMESLRKSFPAMLRYAVPGIAVPLTRDGCKDTTFDMQLLDEALTSTDDAPPFALLDGKIDKRLKSLFSVAEVEKHIRARTPFLRDFPREVYHAICGNGKHYRPLIAFGTYAALTNSNDFPQYMDKIALAIECFHKASLIHDDIEDGDETRYDKPTLHQRIGIPAALNIGDFLIGEGYRLLADPSIPVDLRSELSARAAQAHSELSLGQAQEFESPENIVSLEQCLETHRLKTAPAFRVALYHGAIAARRFEQYRDLFHEFADLFGVSYQLKDDLEDTVPNPASAVDCLIRSKNMSREVARTEIIELYEGYRRKSYDKLEEIAEPLLKIFMYRIVGKVLSDV